MALPWGPGTHVVPFPITNEQFLKAIFGPRWGEVLVSYFQGDPKTARNWQSYPAATVLGVMHAGLNNYYDVSLPSAAGGRTGASFDALYAIVIDDYGVKVDPAKVEQLLGVGPNYVIETSPGNYHAGWFIEPLCDRAWVLGLLRDLYRALGAGDNLVKPTTLVRLPVGSNGKAELITPFKVKLVHWQPGTRIQHLDWIDIEARLGAAVVPVNAHMDLGVAAMPDPADIESDLILKIFRGRGMVLGLGRSMTFGWGFDVECPWASEHTDPRTAASYVPVRERFKCHHGHCQDRNIADVREWADGVVREDSGGLECLASLAFDEFPSYLVPGLTGLVPGQSNNVNPLGAYEATEDGLALAFADRHRGRLRFDHTRGRWFQWTGEFWRQDETQHAADWARDLAREFRGSLQDLTPGQVRAWGKVAVAKAIELAARADQRLAVDGRAWDQNPWLAGAPGCAIDLRSGAIMPPGPEHLITKQLLVTPKAMPTPIWDQFLWDSTGGDLDMIAFNQAWSGYNLSGDTSEEKFVFIYGPGGNGKGTFLHTISAILNDYGARTAADMFMVRKHDAHPEEIARLTGVRAVTATEIEAGRTFNAVRLKDFTGRDGKITGRFMRENTFEFVPQFKVTFVGNNQPRLTNVDEAMRRRIVLVPFMQVPAQADTSLKDRLVAEYPGILQWMIEGELLRRAAGGLSALIPHAAVQATQSYLDDQDTLKAWAKDRCVFSPGKQMPVLKALEDYRLWCHDQGEHADLTKQDFSRKFLEAFPCCRKVHVNSGWALSGVALSQQDVGVDFTND
jgi:putative DNA primase/helicase